MKKNNAFAAALLVGAALLSGGAVNDKEVPVGAAVGAGIPAVGAAVGVEVGPEIGGKVGAGTTAATWTVVH